MPLSDLSLSQRLERTEALANASFVETRARLQPALGPCWIEVAGAYAMFDGIHSPCTQTFGLGLFADPTEGDLALLEDFFESRYAPVIHEVSPLAGIGLYARLQARGYSPSELTSVMCQSLNSRGTRSPDPALTVRRIETTEASLWARISAEGWRQDIPEFANLIEELGQVSASRPDSHCFLVESSGGHIATGALSIHQGVAMLAGASTLPAWRGRGAQRALLDARLTFAREQGCDLAMMCAAPGSASQRNAQREGFWIAYTRLKWSRGIA